MKTITCENCLKTFSSESLRKICGNCFLCTGCEIYLCPKCGEEIVVTPLDPDRFSQKISDSDESN